MAQGTLVDSHAQRAQVFVVAHAFKLHDAAVEQEALVGYELDGAYAEACHDAVAQAVAVIEAAYDVVQVGRVEVPALRAVYEERLVDDAVRRAVESHA